MIKLSIVIPVYNGKDSLVELVERLKEACKSYDWELILVDDSCPEKSWDLILELAKTESRVIGVKLSRNFGQHQAITAGLSESSGDYVVVMDCDLQDRPEYIPDMVNQLVISNSDILFTKKRNRRHSFFKNISAKVFNLIFNYFVANKLMYSDQSIGNFSVLTRKVVNEYLKFKDTHRHYLMLLRWLGFKRDYFYIEHDERKYGKSSYNFKRLMSHALDGITSQSDKLLKLCLKVAMLIFLLLFFLICYIVTVRFTTGALPGWSSLVIISLSSLFINLSFLGVIGIYLGKVFDQVKERPLYIVQEVTNGENN